jgi:hypothetical protein
VGYLWGCLDRIWLRETNRFDEQNPQVVRVLAGHVLGKVMTCGPQLLEKKNKIKRKGKEKRRQAAAAGAGPPRIVPAARVGALCCARCCGLLVG